MSKDKNKRVNMLIITVVHEIIQLARLYEVLHLSAVGSVIEEQW